MKDNDILTIERKLDYTFKDKALLIRAFTHSSAAHDAQKNYESLEFLGDSVLDLVVAKQLMRENPNAHEGALTQRRSEIVSQKPLEDAIDRLGLAEFLIVGKGESVQTITEHTKVKSNMFEAIVGAIYLDSGCLADAEKFILSKLRSFFDGSCKHEGRDFKSELNEFASRHRVSVSYAVVGQGGKPHAPVFTVDVLIDGVPAGRGKGASKKAAEQDAARIALEHIAG